MMIFKFYTFVFCLLVSLVFVRCSTNQSAEREEPASDSVQTSVSVSSEEEKAVIAEAFMTNRDEGDNVDSPAIWHGAGGEHLLLATAKEGNAIIVYDAATGDFVRRFGEVGEGKGAFSRPNGIAVVDDLLLIAERDNHRIQVFSLPDFSPLGFFGESELIRPYGITVASTDTSYEAFITDNYETANEEVPPTDSLGHRVHHFRFTINNSKLESEHVKAFGDTSGEGVLHKVESLLYDVQMQRLLIADELESQRNIKIYTPDGEFTGSTISSEYFAYEPEGIALFACEADTSGYYIATDQDEVNNSFQVFDRKTLRHMGTFGGEATRNTDGVAISQQSFGDFTQGAFYPVHDDGSVAAIALSEIFEALQLKTSCR